MSYSARCRVQSSSALQVALTIDATDEGNNLNKAPLRHRGENVQGIQLAEVVRGSAGMVPKNEAHEREHGDADVLELRFAKQCDAVERMRPNVML